MQRDATPHPQAPALAAPAVPASSQSCHCHGALCCGIRGSLSGPADHPGHILPEGRHMFGSRVGGKPGRPCSRWAGGQAQRPCPASLLRWPPACHTPPPGTHSVSRLSRPSRLWVPRRWMRLLWRCLCGEKGHVRLGAHSPGRGRGRAAAGAGRWRQKHRRMAPALGPSVSSDTAIGPAAEVTRSGAGPTAGCAGLNSDGGERNSPAAADRLPPPSDRGLQSAGAGGGSGRGSLCGPGPGTQPA